MTILQLRPLFEISRISGIIFEPVYVVVMKLNFKNFRLKEHKT